MTARQKSRQSGAQRDFAVFALPTRSLVHAAAPLPSSPVAAKAVTYEQAASSPVAALTALQGLRLGKIQPGHRVLVNGAAGGVGTFAVQIAKAL